MMADRALSFSTLSIFKLIISTTPFALRPKSPLVVSRELGCIKHLKATSAKFWFICWMTMHSWMVFACGQLKVLNAIITPITISMMHALTSRKFPAKIFSHNSTMDKTHISANVINFVILIITNHIDIITHKMADVKLGRMVYYRR